MELRIFVICQRRWYIYVYIYIYTFHVYNTYIHTRPCVRDHDRLCTHCIVCLVVRILVQHEVTRQCTGKNIIACMRCNAATNAYIDNDFAQVFILWTHMHYSCRESTAIHRGVTGTRMISSACTTVRVNPLHIHDIERRCILFVCQ